MMQERHADYVSRYRDRSEDELDRLLEELDDLEGVACHAKALEIEPGLAAARSAKAR